MWNDLIDSNKIFKFICNMHLTDEFLNKPRNKIFKSILYAIYVHVTESFTNKPWHELFEFICIYILLSELVVFNITFISKLKLVLLYNLIIVPLVVHMKNAGLLASTSCTENKTFFMWIWLYYKNLVAAKWIIQRIHSSMYTQLSYSVPYVKANETLHYYTITENI